MPGRGKKEIPFSEVQYADVPESKQNSLERTVPVRFGNHTGMLREPRGHGICKTPVFYKYVCVNML